MTEKKSDKPVTLADYIPSEPAPKKRSPSKSDRDRLKQLEREAWEEKRTGSPRKKRRVRVKKQGSFFGFLFWMAIIFGFIFLFVD